MPRTKAHGMGGTQIQPEPEVPAKRETRGSKRKAHHIDDPDEDGINGVVDSASELDEAPATQPERRSPRKVRKTRALSEAASETNSLIVKLKYRSKGTLTRGTRKSAEPLNGSRAHAGGSRRRRLDTPPEIPSPIEDEGDDVDADIAPVQIVASTPSSPATPDQYAGYDGSATTPDQKPKWEEPDIVGFHYDYKLKMDTTPESQKKLEYVMGVDPKIRDELTEEQRNALNESQLNEDTDNPTLLVRTTRRGGYRGRGKGGRGRGGKSMSTREVPEESEVIVTGSGRGRGGYRVKKSENPRIQSLYHRRAALRHQFKAVANLQRAALEAYADKSLETLKADPEAHARMPEFSTVTSGVGEVFDALLKKTEAKLRIHRQYLAKRRENDEEYERIKKRCAVEVVYDDIVSELMMRAEHLSNEYDVNDGEGAPRPLVFKNKEDGERQIVRFEKSKKHVALEATPMFRPGDFEAIVDENIPTIGDTEFEQHPANYHMADPRIRQAQEQTVRQERANQKSKKSGRSTKTLLGAPTTGPAPVPFEVLEAQDLDNDSPMDSDAGPVENLDKHGVKLPKKQQPKNGNAPNNRFIVEKHFSYEDYEIGNRNVKTKRTNTGEAIYMGKEGNPNPKSFHFDQRANGYNSARNKPEDLDEQQVKIFGLHPTYGLAINGCRNLNYEEYAEEVGEDVAAQQKVLKPRTDWTQPLPPTQPKIFIEEERGFDPLRIKDDRQKRIFRTSRSEHHLRTEQICLERPSKENIEVMLREMWPEFLELKRGPVDPVPELISPSPSPVSDHGNERAIEEDHISLSNIVAAATKLETDEQARLARARVTETRPRRAFDPVRDISPPPPPPEDRTSLNILASAAGNSRVTAPTLAPAPVVPAPPPPPPPPQQQQQQQQQHPLPPQTMQTQYHPFARNWPPQFSWARPQPQHNPVSMAPHPLSHPLNQNIAQGQQSAGSIPPPPPPPSQQHVTHQQQLLQQQQQQQQQQGRNQGGGSSSLRQLLPAPQSGPTGTPRYSY